MMNSWGLYQRQLASGLVEKEAFIKEKTGDGY